MPRRSDGVLSQEEAAECRNLGIPLAYDPVQIGWVRLDCEDDLADGTAPLSWRVFGHQSFSYRFRGWRSQDAPALASMLSSPRLWQYLPEGFGGPMESNTALELIALSNGSDHHLVRAVEFDGKVIGQTRLDFRGGDREAAEISYWLGEAYWGQGHGSAIVARFAEESLRDRQELKRLIALVHHDNLASTRVLTKAGFRRRANAEDELWHTYERHRAAYQRTGSE